jgi:hypothetical protein
MKLSVLAVLLGLVFGLPNIYGLMNPQGFRELARSFPRSKPVGVALMLTATAWFLYYVSLESVVDFLAFKPILYALFVAVGIGTCFFVQDFLPVRGLAVLLLLLAKLMVDTARWVDTEWRLVIMTWAYVWVIAGMWLTISPWRLRDLIHWGTATPQRIRLLSGLRLAFGLSVVLLGLTAYRNAETSVGRLISASNLISMNDHMLCHDPEQTVEPDPENARQNPRHPWRGHWRFHPDPARPGSSPG